jgi:hypothetical protein
VNSEANKVNELFLPEQTVFVFNTVGSLFPLLVSISVVVRGIWDSIILIIGCSQSFD